MDTIIRISGELANRICGEERYPLWHSVSKTVLS